MHISWSGKEVDEKLHFIMASIHDACVKFGKQKDGHIDYVKGRQHRRLHESRTGYARAGCIVILFLYTKEVRPSAAPSFILSVSKNRGSTRTMLKR